MLRRLFLIGTLLFLLSCSTPTRIEPYVIDLNHNRSRVFIYSYEGGETLNEPGCSVFRLPALLDTPRVPDIPEHLHTNHSAVEDILFNYISELKRTAEHNRTLVNSSYERYLKTCKGL
jgi:hypothetical protein